MKCYKLLYILYGGVTLASTKFGEMALDWQNLNPYRHRRACIIMFNWWAFNFTEFAKSLN